MPFTLTDLPTEEVRDLGARLGFDLVPDEAEALARVVHLDRFADLDRFGHDTTGGVAGDRSPVSADDPHNAFVTPLSLSTGNGALADLDVAVKDNIAVAGVPMTCGSRVFESAIPRRDATVVKDLLAAGVRVVGKINMDELAFAPTGETSQFGPTINPVDEGRVTGGSSSGSAAAVASGTADAALGSDTGGSVRIPAAFCGLVGFQTYVGHRLPVRLR